MPITYINRLDYYHPVEAKRAKYKVKPKSLPEGCRADQPEILPKGSVKLELTRGMFAIVDEDMFEELERFNWNAKPDYKTAYATCADRDKNIVYMHRYVMNLPQKDDSGYVVDHLNGNGLDNRRENLEVKDHSGNQENRGQPGERPKMPKSSFKGVSKANVEGWSAVLKLSDGTYKKKNFPDEIGAALYFDEMVRQYRGPDSKTNASRGLYFGPDREPTSEDWRKF